MKFTQTLLKCQANEWKEWYIAYQKLKEIIKKEPEVFKQSLLNELNRINEFYIFIEKKALEEKEIVFSSVLGDIHSDILEVQPFRSEGVSCDRCNDSKDKSNTKGNVGGKENNINNVFNSTDINGSNLDESNPSLTLESCINNSSYNTTNNNNNHSNINSINNDSPVTFLKINSFFKKHSLHRKREKLLIDFISTLSTIKKYKDLNFTGFQKILKKFDKKMGVNLKDILIPVIKGSYFNTSKHIEKALEQSKDIYRSYFAKSNSKAKSVFRRIIQEKQPSQVTPFMSGMTLTLGVTLFSLSCKSLPLLIPLNILILASLLFGLNMVIFDLKFINYKLIFQHDISSSINTGEYLLLVGILCLVNNTLYYIQPFINIPIPVIPIILIFIIITPVNFLYKKTRYFFLMAIFKVISSPFFSVKFRHFYIADCLLSYSMVLSLIFSTSYIPLIFLTFRILQCIRRYLDTNNTLHLYNLGKYLTGVIFFIISKLYLMYSYLYLVFYLIGYFNTLYSLYWDFKVDWGLTRKKRLFNISVYLFIALYDVVGRLSWIISRFYESKYFFILFEVVRRFLWTILRVEYEHLNNCDQLKALRGVDLPVEDLFYQEDRGDIETV